MRESVVHIDGWTVMILQQVCSTETFYGQFIKPGGKLEGINRNFSHHTWNNNNKKILEPDVSSTVHSSDCADAVKIGMPTLEETQNPRERLQLCV
eukprot:scaffold78837_cov21-Tisochrysis_lutea.AAC.2